MPTSYETRRERLEILIEKYGSIPNLNIALGWPRTNATLNHVREAYSRPGRNKPYQMGETTARAIEDALKLERGWMDTPVAFGLQMDMRILHAVRVMENMSEKQRDRAVEMLDALAQPTTDAEPKQID